MTAPLFRAETLIAMAERVEHHVTPSGLLVLGAQEIATPAPTDFKAKPPQPTAAMKREAIDAVERITGKRLPWKAARKWLKRNAKIRKP